MKQNFVLLAWLNYLGCFILNNKDNGGNVCVITMEMMILGMLWFLCKIDDAFYFIWTVMIYIVDYFDDDDDDDEIAAAAAIVLDPKDDTSKGGGWVWFYF